MQKLSWYQRVQPQVLGWILFSATQLGTFAIRGALQRSQIKPSEIDEVYLGNVLSGNLGQAPARQAALGAGIPVSVHVTFYI